LQQNALKIPALYQIFLPSSGVSLTPVVLSATWSKTTTSFKRKSTVHNQFQNKILGYNNDTQKLVRLNTNNTNNNNNVTLSIGIKKTLIEDFNSKPPPPPPHF
jgi:hypothetical protein